MSFTTPSHDRDVIADTNVTPINSKKNKRITDAYKASYDAVIEAAHNMGSPACDLPEKASMN